jgi:hypothetical protein
MLAIALIVILVTRIPWLWFGHALVSFPFYYIGKHYKKQILENTSKRDVAKAIRMAICMVLMVALPLINGKVSMFGICLGNLRFPFDAIVFYICAMAGTMFALDLSSFFTRPNTIITKIAKSLLSIVGFQYIFVIYYQHHIGFDQSILFSSAVAILIMLLCIIMHDISTKLFPFVFQTSK